MALDRSSATACLLVLVACVLALSVPSPSERREHQSANEEAGPRRPAKASYRIYFRDEASALEWLRGFAEVLAKGESAEPDPQTLAKACAALRGDSIEDLLKDQSLWAKTPFPSDAWLRWVRLVPIRTALVERYALVDLPRALRALPEETGPLLRAAARRDGARALEDWLAFREEWRANFKPMSSFSNLGPGLDVPLGPDQYNAEVGIVATFMEGWGSSDPEAAWTLLSVDRPNWTTGVTLAGLVTGLKPGSEWDVWAQRLEAVDWGKARYGASFADHDPYLALSSRWIRDNPDLAVAWYRRWENHCENTSGAPDVMFPVPDDPGSGGHQRYSGEVFLFSRWIGEEESDALAWLDKNAVEDLLLGQIIAASPLGEAPKMKVLDLIGEAEIHGEAAVRIASDSAKSIWPLGNGQERDQHFVELMNSLYALENLEDLARQQLAEITVKRLKMDE